MAKLKACFADYCLGIFSGMESICTALAKVPLEKLHAVQLARVGRPMTNPFASPQQHDKPRIDYAALHTSPILAPRSSPLLGTPPSLSIDEMGDKTQTQLRALSHEQVIQVSLSSIQRRELRMREHCIYIYIYIYIEYSFEYM